jgi:predicted transcriptional regulator/transcriptional regulator with XRE-family HTH domain
MTRPAIGYKVREHRKHLGLTQAALARQLGISPSYLNLIEANKRSIGGQLANKLARALGLEVESLTGAAEQRLRDDLLELPADPVLRHINLEDNYADEIVARNPNWARMILALYRAYLDSDQALSLLSDRLNQDPWLQAAMHQVLTRITTIRSTSEILATDQPIDPIQRSRFQKVLHEESTRLTDTAQELISHLELQNTLNPSLAAEEQVDEFIIGERNYFPALEEAGIELRGELERLDRANLDAALARHLEQGFGIRIETAAYEPSRERVWRNQSCFDADNRVLGFLANAPSTTRRFQMARIVAELTFADTLAAQVNDPRLTNEAARVRATSALASYVAGAALFPYVPFLEDAERQRYDIEILRQKYEAGFEQICHRLVTLRAPGAEGVPFAFLRVDPSGYISKRFPLFGLSLPRFGHACPLWPVFSAFQTPGRVVRELGAFPGGNRFLMIARTVTKRAATFRDQPVMFSVMLACEVLHADRTIYAEGIDLGAVQAARPVGSTCRQCQRLECQQRQEAPVTSRGTQAQPG